MRRETLLGVGAELVGVRDLSGFPRFPESMGVRNRSSPPSAGCPALPVATLVGAWPHNFSSRQGPGSSARRRGPATAMIREKLRLPGGGWGGRSMQDAGRPRVFWSSATNRGSSGCAGEPVNAPFQPAQRHDRVGTADRCAVSSPRNRHPRPPWVRHRSPRPTAGPPQGDPPEGSAGTEPMGVRDPLH